MSVKQQLIELHNAIRKDDISSITALLMQNGKLVNKPYLDVCALELCQSTEAIDTVIAGGADIHRLNKSGQSALYSQTFSRRLDLVKKLLELGMVLDEEGESLLLLSISRRDEKMVDFWLSQGLWANDALHECASAGNPESILLLLKSQSSEVNCLNNQGYTPLDVTMNYSSSRHQAIARILIAHGGRCGDNLLSESLDSVESEATDQYSAKKTIVAKPSFWRSIKSLFTVNSSTAAYDDNEFWALISLINFQVNTSEIMALPLEAELVKRGINEIHLFDQKLTQMLYLLDGPAWMKQAGDSAHSGDGFLYVRCFVVAKGKDYFNAILNNPKKMPKSADAWFEPLLYVAPNAWSQITGNYSSEFESKSDLSYETGSNSEQWAGE